MSSSQERHVYVDTQYIHAFIFYKCLDRPNEEERFAKEQFNSLLYNRDSFFLKIPMIAMGETINNINRRELTDTNKDDIIRELLRIMSIPKVDILPAKSDCFELTIKLLSEDSHLDNTDTLIVAQALCDPLSTHLLMKDEKVITSPAIEKVNKELFEDGIRPRKLTITPEM